MFPIVRLAPKNLPLARQFWCPIGSLVGSLGTPLVIFELWHCIFHSTLGHAFSSWRFIVFAVVLVLGVLCFNCVLVFVSEIWDISSEIGSRVLNRERHESTDAGVARLQADIAAYGSDAAATSAVDVRWKHVKAFVWAKERPLLVFYAAAIVAAVFWIIPACVRDCAATAAVYWCQGDYRDVGPLGILGFALTSTVARNEYPRPFRRIYEDYIRMLALFRGLSSSKQVNHPD